MRVGVLALQGGFEAHAHALRRIGHSAALVRRPDDLATCDGLVLPGGESTVHLKLIDRAGLAGPLADFVTRGRPVLATCAGLILAAARVEGGQRSFGWLDVTVARNAYGRQKDSFEAASDDGTPLVFIRAPRITAVGARARVLMRHAGEPVLVGQGAVLGATFHPELTADARVHQLAFGEIELTTSTA